MTFDEYVAIFQERLWLPDPYPLLAAAGAVAANRIDGEPAWLVLVGPSSSGKTVLLEQFLALNHVEALSDLTLAGLLTDPGSRGQGTGGVLNRLGPAGGIIIIKDMSWLFAARTESEGRIIPAMREVHDGSMSRAMGSRGGRTIEWPGDGRRAKLGLLAAATDVIDLHAGLVNAMGPRMIFARMPKPDHRAVITAAARNVGRADEMRAAFAAATVELFDALDPSRVAQPDGVVDEALRDISEFVAIARSPVQRDRNGRIVLVGEPEVGSRLYQGLAQQRRGLIALGCDAQRAHAVARRMGMDSIPALHRHIVDHLVSVGVEAPGTHNIASGVDYPPATAVDVLEELAARGVVERILGRTEREDRWSLSEWTRSRLASAESSAPSAGPTGGGLEENRFRDSWGNPIDPLDDRSSGRESYPDDDR
jgi:hypothetical protein